LVALSPALDLLFRAKHLFVAAMVAGCGVTWLNEGGANRPQGARSAGYFLALRRRGGSVAAGRVASIHSIK
jgi:hypothetical protein